MAVVGDYPPYDIHQDGKAFGIVNDMAKEVFARLGIFITIRQLPFKRALENLKSGDVDAIAGVGRRAGDFTGIVSFGGP